MKRARDHNAIGEASQTLKFADAGDIRTPPVGRPPKPGDRGGYAVDTGVCMWCDRSNGRQLFVDITAIHEFRLPIGTSHDITM